jgi:hypothetical protein
MSFVPLTGSPNIPKFEYVADASTSFTKGYLAYRDTSTGEIKEATTTTGDVTNIEGIVAETVTTEASSPRVDLYQILPGQLYVADCTNNTAADQLNKAHLLTDGGTVNNTSTHSTDVNAVFIALAISGVAADKKLIGRFALPLGQVAA